MPVKADPVNGGWGIGRPVPMASDIFSLNSHSPDIDIIDIRRDDVQVNLKEEIRVLFNCEDGPRCLPTLLLYDERGLQLFEKITYLEEYYLTNSEIDILKRSAAELARAIPWGSMVIELGSGNLRKVVILLEALENAGKSIDYYALDLSRKELERTLAHVPEWKFVKCHGLHGTYNDGREWLKKPEISARHKCLLNLGSSIGNFERDEAASFLRSLADVLGPSDLMLIGLDACQNPAKVYHAYNDRGGITHRFVLNGLCHANRVLGEDVFNPAEWRTIGEYVFDGQGGRHQAFYSPTRDTAVFGTVVRRHDKIQIERSVKYSRSEADRLWELSGLRESKRWTSTEEEYGIHLLAKAKMPFSLLPSVYASSSVPTLEDWKGVWDAWDVVTGGMLPRAGLLEKPIKLRNACIFYLGHIPAFLDVQLTKTTGDPLTEPEWYRTIFERGIDPDVDNPEVCHDHSEIPDEWPPLKDVISYQNRVRHRLRELYERYGCQMPRKAGRGVWLGFEHELMHLETLLYMLLQSEKTLPPPIAPRPNFEKLAEKARSTRVENQWFAIPEQQIVVGLDDPESDENSDPGRHYGWDNEKPPRQVRVRAFEAKGRPITNEEYATYLISQGIEQLPASWSRTKCEDVNTPDETIASSLLPASHLGNLAVKTVYGLVPLKHALDWPVFASYDELAGCAAWMDGRIPTFEETRSIYEYVNALKKEDVEQTLGKTVPAVNAHLVNNGVRETPPTTPESEVGEESCQSDLFINLDKANVGFQHWHPTPVSGSGDKLAGQGELGGVWEWTSSILEKYEHFKPMALYPGYTADFFDGKHNIVLGGSWATHPRIAGRKSFVNWYQRNYPYAWVGARLVRDSEGT